MNIFNPTKAGGNGRAVCVFCGSSHGGDPRFTQAARTFGALLAQHGFSVVFGGGGLGLMGETAAAAHGAGARVQGILPDFLKHLEPPLQTGERVIITHDLFTRKSKMMAMADAFAILPGGTGTMDEFFEVLTAAQLKLSAKPIVLVNIADYFAPLIALLDHIVASGFAAPSLRALFHVCATPQDAVALLGNLLERAPAD